MLKNRIIPCLDVKNGRVVKGINFVDLKDAGDPVEQAKIYSDGGADEICFLDITASNENRDTIYDVVEKTSKKCFVPLTVGGGVRSVEDINKLLNCGADKVSINTAAVQNSEVVVESSKKFGSQCIVVAIDAKKIQIIGKFLLTVEEIIQELMQSNLQKKWKIVEQVSYWLLLWIEMEHKLDTTLN